MRYAWYHTILFLSLCFLTNTQLHLTRFTLGGVGTKGINFFCFFKESNSTWIASFHFDQSVLYFHSSMVRFEVIAFHNFNTYREYKYISNDNPISIPNLIQVCIMDWDLLVLGNSKLCHFSIDTRLFQDASIIWNNFMTWDGSVDIVISDGFVCAKFLHFWDVNPSKLMVCLASGWGTDDWLAISVYRPSGMVHPMGKNHLDVGWIGVVLIKWGN